MTEDFLNSGVLITGGAGFLGSHLCERLVKLGKDIICLDNLYTGTRKNIMQFDSSGNVKFINHDIVIPFTSKSTEIYNLACPASPVHYQKNPVSTTETAVLGVLNVLKVAEENNAKVFQASTSEVYGDAKVHPQTEDYFGNVNPVGVRACYDEGKRCAETLCFDYKRQFGTDVRVGRIFNSYGPRMQINDGRVISNFITQALKNEPITVYGSGEQTRSFCYVDDLIDGILKLMESNVLQNPINIGNPSEITILELADKICEITKSKSKVLHKPLPFDDPVQRCPDISKITTLTVLSPTVSLEDCFKKTITYFKKELNL